MTAHPKGRRATIQNQPRRGSEPWFALALLLAASAAVSACAQSMPAGTQPARSLPAKVASTPRFATVEPRTMLRNVTILRGRTSVEVHIEASGPVKPVALVLSQPERIVVDLADVGYDSSRRLPVNAGDVEGVRVALFQADPPVTRVVVDLAHPHEYRLLSAGSTVILAIDTSPRPAIAAQPAETKAALVAATNAAPPPAVPPVTTAQPPAEAKLQPPPLVQADAPPVVGQPATPTVSTTLPQALSVPLIAAQSSGEDETSPHQAAKGQKPGVVRSVTVSHEKDYIQVHIEGSKPLRASASTLSDPERIIIDLANVRLDRPRRIPVNASDVKAVNASLYLVNPLMTRVVVDLTRPHPYSVQASGNSVTVRIGAGIGSNPVR